MHQLKLFSLGLFLLIITAIMPSVASAGSYNGNTAVNYALAYCGVPNEMGSAGYSPAFISFESDCTNFVSQALLYGGWTEAGWNILSTSSWFYDGDDTSYISRTWRLVDYFESFLDSSGRASGPYAVDSSTFSSYLPGDIVLASWDGDSDMEHVYIVTAVFSNKLELAAHTTNRCGDPFDTSDVWAQKPATNLQGYFMYSSY